MSRETGQPNPPRQKEDIKRIKWFVIRYPVLLSPLVRLLLRYPYLYRKLKIAARGLWQVWGQGAMPVPEPDMTADQLPSDARQIYDQLQAVITSRRSGRP